jgi:hypothetical protein
VTRALVDVKALEQRHQTVDVKGGRYTLIETPELVSLISALRVAVEALRGIEEGRGKLETGPPIVRIHARAALAKIAEQVTL